MSDAEKERQEKMRKLLLRKDSLESSEPAKVEPEPVEIEQPETVEEPHPTPVEEQRSDAVEDPITAPAEETVEEAPVETNSEEAPSDIIQQLREYGVQYQEERPNMAFRCVRIDVRLMNTLDDMDIDGMAKMAILNGMVKIFLEKHKEALKKIRKKRTKLY